MIFDRLFSAESRQPYLLWAPVVLGLVLVCAPTLFSLSRTSWSTEENGHGPIIFLVFIWLLWEKRQWLVTKHLPSSLTLTQHFIGWCAFGVGLLMYVVGRSQSINTIEVAAFIPMLVGIALLKLGFSGLKRFLFPIGFLLFMVPLPGVLVEAVTGTLKRNVSIIVENILYFAGYPVGRDGVMISIGQYHLLVADACSGMNSMFSLSALGLLYLYIIRYKNWAHTAIMLLAILPIAFAANVIRVCALVLITYYFGDEAGQGFAHSATGMVLFIVALSLLFALDWLLKRVFAKQRVGLS